MVTLEEHIINHAVSSYLNTKTDCLEQMAKLRTRSLDSLALLSITVSKHCRTRLIMSQCNNMILLVCAYILD